LRRRGKGRKRVTAIIYSTRLSARQSLPSLLVPHEVSLGREALQPLSRCIKRPREGGRAGNQPKSRRQPLCILANPNTRHNSTHALHTMERLDDLQRDAAPVAPSTAQKVEVVGVSVSFEKLIAKRSHSSSKEQADGKGCLVLCECPQLPGATLDACTFAIHNEDHTLGNALRYIIMKKYVRRHEGKARCWPGGPGIHQCKAKDSSS